MRNTTRFTDNIKSANFEQMMLHRYMYIIDDITQCEHVVITEQKVTLACWCIYCNMSHISFKELNPSGRSTTEVRIFTSNHAPIDTPTMP